MRNVAAAGLSFLLSLAAIAYGQPDAQSAAPASHVAATRQEISLIEALLPKLADRAAGEFQLAHDYADLGELEKAQALLLSSAQTGKGFNPDGEKVFQAFANDSSFRELVNHVETRYPAVHRAKTAFTIRENDLIPEGLASDNIRHLFYLSSLYRRKVVNFESGGVASDLFPSGKYQINPICGVKVEQPSGSIWAATCSDNGSGAELLRFTSRGDLLERYPPPGGGAHLFNDLVLLGADKIYLTDSLSNHVYRFDRRAHTFTELALCRPVYYPNGITLRGDSTLYVADAFGILQVNLKTGSSRELDPGPSNTVSGVDGLYWYKDGLVAVQNGIGKPRVARFHLSSDGSRVTRTTILDYRSSELSLPTTGTIIGSRFYFVANSQIDNFRDGQIVNPSKLEPVKILALDLQD